MIRFYLYYLMLCFVLFLVACSSSHKATRYAKSLAQGSKVEPCWIKRPACQASNNDTALYFVGQSAEPIAHWGRPKRQSTLSAQADAEAQYARFLGVNIESSIYLKELLDDTSYQSQFTHTLSSTLNHVVSDIVKADEYFAAYQETSEGQPLWTVYVLIKVTRETINKHRAAIAEEVKRIAQAKNKETPILPVKDKWIAKVFNIDDSATIYINDILVRRCEFSRSCTVEMTQHFKKGSNHIRLDFSNRLGFWTYGYEVRKNKQIMYKGSCGQVWIFGCSWNMSLGVVHTFKFEVEKK